MTNFSTIGKRIPKPDALPKVTGVYSRLFIPSLPDIIHLP